MKKKVCIVIIPLVLVMVVVSIIIVKSSSTQKMLSIPKEEITKILVTDGNNGNVTELTKEQTDKLYNIDIFRKNSSISIIVISNEECSISNKKYSIKENKGKEIIDMVKEFTDK